MVTRDIVELDAVLVEVVEHGQAELVALAVVGLPASGAASVGPSAHLRDALSGAVGPPHATAADATAGPEVILAGTD